MTRSAVLFATIVLLGLAAGCDDTKSPTPAAAESPAPTTVPKPTPPTPERADAGTAPVVNAAADAGVDAAKPKGGGLLPEPDFTLRGPSLKAPSLGKKKGVFGDGGQGSTDKARLLDTKLTTD